MQLDADDPRIKASDKTYVGFKAQGMGFDAHLTVFYLGKITVLQEQLAQIVIDKYKHLDNTPVERIGFDMFGPDYTIPVVRVAVPLDIWALRQTFERHSYLPNPSEYNWNPHITLNHVGVGTITIHPTIRIDQLGLY